MVAVPAATTLPSSRTNIWPPALVTRIDVTGGSYSSPRLVGGDADFDATTTASNSLAASAANTIPGCSTVEGNVAALAMMTGVPSRVTVNSFSENSRGSRTQPCDAG